MYSNKCHPELLNLPLKVNKIPAKELPLWTSLVSARTGLMLVINGKRSVGLGRVWLHLLKALGTW